MAGDVSIEKITEFKALITYKTSHGPYTIVVETHGVSVDKKIKDAVQLADMLLANRCFPRLMTFTPSKWDIVFQLCRAENLYRVFPGAFVEVVRIYADP